MRSNHQLLLSITPSQIINGCYHEHCASITVFPAFLRVLLYTFEYFLLRLIKVCFIQVIYDFKLEDQLLPRLI